MTKALAIVASIVVLGAAGTLAPEARASEDWLRAALEQSMTDNRGLTFYVNGQAIPGVVIAIGDKYLIARNREQGTVVIQFDRLDAVAGFVELKDQ